MVGLSVLAFMIMLSYSFSRPATESLFLDAHTSAELPYVWLLMALVAVITVGLFARLLARIELIRLLGYTAAGSGVVLAVLLVLLAADFPAVYYSLYIWKDIYIVLLVETFYSFANTVFPIRTARWAYGGFGVASALGSITGNLVSGALAEQYSTAAALNYVPPMLLLMGVFCLPLSKYAGAAKAAEQAKVPPRFLDALKVVRKSSYLFLLVVLIAGVQVAVTLIDYQYNQIVEQVYTDTDQRTAIFGRVYATISGATLVLHVLTGPTLRLVGVPAVLLAVPLLLGVGLGAFAMVPRFLTAALVKVASKCFDYTIFRAAKEMLYIPLNYAEKTQGKSIVDVLSYRVAKGGASLLLMGLLAVGAGAMAAPLTFVVIGVWLVLTVVVARRFRQKVSRNEEMKGQR